MRMVLRWAALTGALALLAAACDVDDPAVDTDNGTEETNDVEEDEEGDNDEYAHAVWDGEELAFTGVSCGTLMADDDYEIRGRIDDDASSHLQARFTYDPEASDGDDIVLADDTPRRLALFFDEGETIGDGREFRADDDALEVLDASVDHVAGTIHLDPQDDTQAPETHPDGGEIEFELRCG